MWCVALVLVLSLLRETLSAPFEKPVLLFSCPRNAECYASPPNCVDDCNAAVSMRHSNGNTTFNITMLSGLQGYVALLMRQNKEGSDDYDKAIICSFHHPRGIVAKVNYPEPIRIQEFIETTEPLGNTDSTHTQCSTTASIAMPSKSSFKLISGKWKSELLIDEKLGVDVVPAVQSAKILSTNEMLSIPEPKKIPSTRSSDESDDDKASEDFVQKNQFENKLRDKNDDDDDTDEKSFKEDDDEKESTRKNSMKPSKKDMGRERKTEKSKGDSKKRNNDEDEKNNGEEEDENKKKSKGSNEESEENPRFRELDEEDEEDENKKNEDGEKEEPDDAAYQSILLSAVITLLLLYFI